MSIKKTHISLKWIIISVVLFLSSVITSIIGHFDYIMQEKEAINNFDNKTILIADKMAMSLVFPLKYSSHVVIDRMVENIMNYKEVCGVTIVPSNPNVPMIIRGRDKVWNIIIPNSEFPTEYYSDKKRNIIYENDNLGEIRIYFTQKFMHESLQGTSNSIIIMIIALNLMIFLTLFFILEIGIFKPLGKIVIGLRNYSFTGESENIIDFPNLSFDLKEIGALIIDLNKQVMTKYQRISTQHDKMEILIKKMPLPLSVIDFSGNIIYLNDKFTEVFGYTLDEIPNLNTWRNCVYRDEKEKLESIYYWSKMLELANSSNASIPVKDNKILCKNGQSKFVEEFRIGIEDTLITIYNDATVRKNIESNISTERENFYKIFAATPIGLALLNKEGYINQINKAFSRIFKKEPQDLLWKNIKDGISCAIRIQNLQECGFTEACSSCIFKNDFDKIIESDNNANGNNICLSLKIDGRIEARWLKIKLGTVYINNLINYLMSIEDITEHKNAEIALLKSEEKFSKAFNNSPVAILMARINDGVILNANNTFESMTGFLRSEVIGKNIFLMDNPKFNDELKKIYIKLSANDWVNNQETEFQCNNGEIITCLLSSDSIEIDGELCAISVFIDITERNLAESELRKSREQLSLFAAHIQNIREEERVYLSRELHDNLGQNLTALRMHAFRIIKKVGGTTANIEIPVALKQAEEMITTIDSTILLVRKISRELRPVVIDDLGLIAAIEWQAEEFTKLSDIHCVVNSNIDKIDLAPNHAVAIFRIIQEALTNIIRHANASEVIIAITKNNDNLNIGIQDNGYGFQEKNLADSKSLGIMGMRERALVVDGSLTITSKQHVGTKITINIPNTIWINND